MTAIFGILASALGPVIAATLAIFKQSKVDTLRSSLLKNVELLAAFDTGVKDSQSATATRNALLRLIEEQANFVSTWQEQEARTFRDAGVLVIGFGFAIPLGLGSYLSWRAEGIALTVLAILLGGAAFILAIASIGAALSPSDKTVDKKLKTASRQTGDPKSPL